MGYRSDVVALVYPDAMGLETAQERYDQLKVLMATTFKETIDGTAGVEGFTSCMHWMDADRVLKFSLDGVKWYEGYPDVQAFEKMLRDLAGEIEGYCTEFMRIGEDEDDTDTRRTGENNQYYLIVSRSIDCNV